MQKLFAKKITEIFLGMDPLEPDVFAPRDITAEYSGVMDSEEEYNQIRYISKIIESLKEDSQASFMLGGVLMVWDFEKELIMGQTDGLEFDLARDFAMTARENHSVHMDIKGDKIWDWFTY